MFKIRSYVNHRYSGVCQIKDIAPLLNKPDGPLYYVLDPLFGEDKGSIVRVPTTSLTALKPILSKKEALSIVDSIKKTTDSYITDTKLRKSTFENYIASGDILKLGILLYGVLKHKLTEGRINAIDNQFLKKATPIVYGNLSISMGVPFEKIEEYIAN